MAKSKVLKGAFDRPAPEKSERQKAKELSEVAEAHAKEARQRDPDADVGIREVLDCEAKVADFAAKLKVIDNRLKEIAAERDVVNEAQAKARVAVMLGGDGAEDDLNDARAKISTLNAEEKELQAISIDLRSAYNVLTSELQDLKVAFQRTRKRVLKPVFEDAMEQRIAQSYELLAWLALADDTLHGIPKGSRTPGVIASKHVDHRELQKAIDAMRDEIDEAFGFRLPAEQEA
ncbi:MAG: hypothetical protein ACR2OR_08920 [Hyphomicrobiales bacterium]